MHIAIFLLSSLLMAAQCLAQNAPTMEEIEAGASQCARDRVQSGQSGKPWSGELAHCAEIEKAWEGIAQAWHEQHDPKPKTTHGLADRLKK